MMCTVLHLTCASPKKLTAVSVAQPLDDREAGGSAKDTVPRCSEAAAELYSRSNRDTGCVIEKASGAAVQALPGCAQVKQAV